MLGARSDDPAAPFVQELSYGQALMSVIANTYATNLMDREMRAREFELLSRVVANVPVRQVTPHSNHEYLGRLCDIIIADFAGVVPRTPVPSAPEISAHV
jgi:hypothetical protein